MHEVEMDENNVVVHTRRGSTAVGVTPSDPSAIVDLFQEVESIGETQTTKRERERKEIRLQPGEEVNCRVVKSADAGSFRVAVGMAPHWHVLRIIVYIVAEGRAAFSPSASSFTLPFRLF